MCESLPLWCLALHTSPSVCVCLPLCVSGSECVCVVSEGDREREREEREGGREGVGVREVGEPCVRVRVCERRVCMRARSCASAARLCVCALMISSLRL